MLSIEIGKNNIKNAIVICYFLLANVIQARNQIKKKCQNLFYRRGAGARAGRGEALIVVIRQLHAAHAHVARAQQPPVVHGARGRCNHTITPPHQLV